MVKRRNKIPLILMSLLTIVMVGVVYWSSKLVQIKVPEYVSQASEASQSDEMKELGFEVISPDGSHTLTMETEGLEGNRVLQIFLVSSDKSEEATKVFEKVVNVGQPITIPHNTFSPDNKYIFLKDEGSGSPEYFVIRTDGQDVSNDQKSINIIESFMEKYQDFIVTDVTGWGGVNLIIVNTDLKEGGIGPSFWFDVSNLSFIRLSHRFN